MQQQPKKIIKIAFDDYLKALEHNVSAETLGKVRDELDKKRAIPNMLKDEKRRVAYDKNNQNQHAFIIDPSHPIVVTHIDESEL